MAANNAAKRSSEFFLPDFCQAQSLFLVVLVAELLAVIFTLLNVQPQSSLWNLLGFYSISIQIVSLVSVSLLCWLRTVLSGLSDWIAGAFSLGIILLTTLAFSLSVIKWYWVLPIDLTQPAQSHMVIRNLFVAGLIGSVALRYFYLQQQYRRQLALEASARLEALQARIRPHFLFNSMNVIASLTRIDPAKAEAAIEDLSDIFRATLDTRQELIPFAEELRNGEKYLAIEQLRLGDRLKITKNITPACGDILLPPLSVQPLLENAVYHGIQMLPEGGVVTINARMENDYLLIEVVNPKAPRRNTDGHGIAMKNISQRLEVIYSGKAKLERVADENCYRVLMTVPKEKPDY